MKKLLLLLLLFHFFFLTAQNNWLWGIYGRTPFAYVNSIATDNKGNCLAFGLFEKETIHFGNYTLIDSTNNLGFFLLKLAPNGNILWANNSDR